MRKSAEQHKNDPGEGSSSNAAFVASVSLNLYRKHTEYTCCVWGKDDYGANPDQPGVSPLSFSTGDKL